MLGLASIFVETALVALSGAALALEKAKASEPTIVAPHAMSRPRSATVESETARLAELETSTTQRGSIHSVAIGHGACLFSALRAPRRLDLIEARTFPSGTEVYVYRRQEGQP